MAQRTVITYYSDLSGDAIRSESGSLQFGLDGTNYEIDLTDKEADKLRKALAPYIEVARKSANSGRGRRRSTGRADPTAKEVRAWAVENGHDVPAKGRIPAPIREAYVAAH